VHGGAEGYLGTEKREKVGEKDIGPGDSVGGAMDKFYGEFETQLKSAGERWVLEIQRAGYSKPGIQSLIGGEIVKTFAGE
jgi:hypothetical protein